MKKLILILTMILLSHLIMAQYFSIRSMETGDRVEENISINETLAGEISSVIKGEYILSIFSSDDKVYFLNVSGDIGCYENDTTWRIIFSQRSMNSGKFSSSIIAVGDYVVVSGDGGIATLNINTGEKNIIYETDIYGFFPLAITSFSDGGFVVQNQETLTKIFVKISWPQKETSISLKTFSLPEVNNIPISCYQVRDIMGNIIREEEINPWENGIEVIKDEKIIVTPNSKKTFLVKGL